jgi:hypothetical protein
MSEVSLRPSPPLLSAILPMLPDIMKQAIYSIQRAKRDVFTTERIHLQSLIYLFYLFYTFKKYYTYPDLTCSVLLSCLPRK